MTAWSQTRCATGLHYAPQETSDRHGAILVFPGHSSKRPDGLIVRHWLRFGNAAELAVAKSWEYLTHP